MTIEQAKLLLCSSPLFVDVVAVMVNPTEKEVQHIIRELPIQWLQFHGKEPPTFCKQFNKPYIKAIRTDSEDTSDIHAAVSQYESASAILLDTPTANHHGGTGQSFDWRVIPNLQKKPLIIAGGLDAENLIHLTERYQPYAVDVCSGIERSAGIKDHDKMAQFVNALIKVNNE